MNIKLGDLCIIQAGGTPSRSKQEYWNNGEIPWVKIGDIESKYLNKTSEFITVEGLKNTSAKKIEKGSILYTIFATLGEVCITNIDVTTNQAIAGITLKDDKVYIDYLYYFLKSLKKHVNAIGRGVAQNNINLTLLRGFEVPIPDKSRQLIIAQSLSNIEKVINNKKQQLKEYDQLIKSRFVEMFGDIIRNDKKWSSASLNDLATVGSSKRIYQSEYSTQGIPFYRSKEIIELGKNEKPSVELFISKERYKEIKANYGVPQVGDILITAVGTIGKIWIVDSNSPFYYKDGNIVYIRSNNFNSIFFKQSLLVLIDNFKIKNVAGSAYPALTIEKLKEMIVVKPPMEYQNEFSEFSQQVDKLKFEYDF